MSVSRHEFRILTLACLGHALTHASMILFTPLLDDMRHDFGLSLPGITFYVTLSNVCFGLGAVPAGWLSDRFAEKRLLGVLFAGIALGLALIATARTTWFLGAGAVVLGLANSIYHPVGMALISKTIRARGRALGINGIFGSLGVAVGPPFAALVAGSFSWRWAFLSLVAPSLVLAGWLATLDLKGPAGPQGAEGQDDEPTGRPNRSNRVLLVFLLAAMTCGGFCYHLITTMLPKTLAEHGPFSATVVAGGVLAGLTLTFGAAGQFLGGVLADRFEARRVYLVNLILVAPAYFTLSLLTGYPLVGAACLAAVLMFAVQPIENTIIAACTPRDWRGRIYGAKFILAFGIGGFGSWAGGIIAERYGLPHIFVLAACVVLLALLCVVVAARVSPAPAGAGSAVHEERDGHGYR